VSRSGDEAGFRDMVARCHAAGVKIYADAVINHTAEMLRGPGVGDPWKEVVVILNSADNYDYPLPPGNWKVAVERSDPAAGHGPGRRRGR
jgi:hypothetical protein